MKIYIQNQYYRLCNSSLFKDSFWSLIGNALAKGSALLASIAVARFLGSDEYGTYGLIKSTLLFIAMFSSFGLGYAATKFIAEDIKSNVSIVRVLHYYNTRITIASSGIIALIVIILATPIAYWLDDVFLAPLLRWSSIGIVFNAIITTQIGELAGFSAYKIIAKNNIISGLLTLICVVPAAYFRGLEGAVAALIFTLFFNCIINWKSINKLLNRIPNSKFKKDNRLLRQILSFSTPIALQESLYSITSWCGMAMLVKLSDFSELGIYSVANQWMAILMFVPGALRNVALSHLSENNANITASFKVTKKLMSLNFIVTFIPFIIILLLRSQFIIKIYGSSYLHLPLVLNISIFTAVITSLSNVLTQEFIAQSKNWFLFWTRLFRDVTIIIWGFIMIQSKIMDAAASLALTNMILQLLYLLLLITKRTYIYHNA